jgi:pyruvyl transferase EpsO
MAWKVGLMTEANASVTMIKKTQDILYKTLSSVAPECQYYSILDFPDYSNVGDSAIFLGELHLLGTFHGSRPSYVCSTRSYVDDIVAKLSDGPLYLQGGGNFGDLWPRHQNFREHILRKHKDRKIIQLPQSVHFDNPKALDQCAFAIDNHADFILLVRDEKSYALAQRKFNCQVLMCPDAAFGLGAIKTTCEATCPVLCMLRSDRESDLTSQQRDEIATYGLMEDWERDRSDMKSKLDRQIEKLFIKLPLSRTILQPSLCKIYEKWARKRMDRGIMQLSKAQFVITDRLHVHILCTLLGIPHLVFDNNYGKISRHINAWPKNEKSFVVHNMDEFRSVMKQKSQKI